MYLEKIFIKKLLLIGFFIKKISNFLLSNLSVFSSDKYESILCVKAPILEPSTYPMRIKIIGLNIISIILIINAIIIPIEIVKFYLLIFI